MKPLLFVAVFAVVCALPCRARADVQTGLVEPYLRIQTALAADALTPIKADATMIVGEAGKLGDAGKPLLAAASEMQGAATLDAARLAFGKLSEALIKYAETTNTSLGPDMKVAYCPMVKKNWVQKGTTIANPYYGKSMLTCGEIVRPIK